MYKRNSNLKQLGMVAAIAIIALIFAAQAAAEDEAEVGFDAPDWVVSSFAVNTKISNIDTDDIKGMRGRFDISFDPNVIKATKIDPCNPDVEIIESDLGRSDEGKISVDFSLSTTTVYRVLVEVEFDIVGDVGDSCDLGISGSIYHRDGDEISAKWTGDTINIGDFDVSVDAPKYVSADTFDADIRITEVKDLESAAFVLSFDPSVVNVTNVKPGKISGTVLQLDWCFDKNGTIIVTSNLPGTEGASGAGTLATITFAVIGANGCSSVLDIGMNSNTDITNTETDKLPINWIDATVTIDSEAPPPQNETDTTVFVKNLDDDKLYIRLFIDGVFEDKSPTFYVSSGSIKKYSACYLVEGPHTFKIKWYDHDTKQEHEKIEEHSVSGESDVVVLYTVEHADKDTKISARVYVKNNDDDPVDVYLDIDGTYKEYETIEAGDTCDYDKDGYEFDKKESHTFKIRWIDPDTDIEYEEITRQYIDAAESVTMQVDLHTEDDLITTSVLASDSSPPPQSSTTSRPASDTSAGSGTVTSESQSPTTVFHTDPTSPGSDAGGSQPYHHIYTLVGVVAIVFAMMQIRKV